MTAEQARPSVLVLGGGPDRERPVSLESARGVARALAGEGFVVHHIEIDRPSRDELAAMPGEVVFPVLHGSFGEGGPLQAMLEEIGRPFVGSRADAAALAMDKLATARLAMQVPGMLTPEHAPLDAGMREPPAPFPLVVKPIRDGSSVGVSICRTPDDWRRAVDAAQAEPGMAFMVESFIAGRELTVGLLDGRALPIIEIAPAAGFYDYEAKYTREDTRYLVAPELPEGVGDRVRLLAEGLAQVLGVRHLARADFILDERGRAWLLEINTMPGFTSHSLLPMAARAAGLEFGPLCARLVHLAQRDASVRSV